MDQFGSCRFFSFWPMINILTRKPSREQEILEFSDKTENILHEIKSYRRSDVMKDWVFWAVVIWLTMIPAFWITGLLFHQIFISELKNIPLTLWMANYFWYALSAIAGAIISGGKGTAKEKINVLENCGIKTTLNPAEMGSLLKRSLG